VFQSPLAMAERESVAFSPSAVRFVTQFSPYPTKYVCLHPPSGNQV